MQQEEISINHKRFFYRTTGEGRAVVLLHGFGEDSSVWQAQYDALPGYRLIIPDLPGSGRSEMTRDMSMEGLARMIYEFLTMIRIDRCVLIGHSMGGYITLAFAEKYGEMLNGFGLFHSTAYADSPEKKETRKKGIDFIQQHGPYEFVKTSIPGLFSPITKAEMPRMIEEQIAAAHNFSGAALVSYYVSMMNRPDRTKILIKTKLPVLFILGKYDGAVPLEEGLRLCHLPELSYIEVFDRSGHMGMKEETNKSNKILTDYLNSTSHQTR